MTTDILALTSEAAVLVQRGRVAFANSSALAVLGQDCLGKTVKALFGADVAGTQAASFIAGASIGGKHFIVRVSRAENGQIIFFSCPEPSPIILNDPFLCAMRSSLMNIGMSAERIRERAEDTGDTLVLSSAASLTRSYYRMIRMTSNASMVLGMADSSLLFSAATVNISSLCRNALETIRHFVDEPEIIMELGDDISLVADPCLVSHVLLNLISNCLVHAEGCTRIKVSLTESSDNVVLSVSDDGCGIAPEELHTVFDRYRHSFEMDRLGGGTGLGLTVTRCIAELHGGTLLLESRAAQGTTVRVSFGRKLAAAVNMYSAQKDCPSCMKEILIGLSDCLPAKFYAEHYMD